MLVEYILVIVYVKNFRRG